jgi:hypothetical protein
MRLLALVLALATSGIVPAVATAQGACNEEIADTSANGHHDADESPDGGCSTDCALCLCCPLRAAPARAPISSSAGVTRVGNLPTLSPLLATRAAYTSIFHPPRAHS